MHIDTEQTTNGSATVTDSIDRHHLFQENSPSIQPESSQYPLPEFELAVVVWFTSPNVSCCLLTALTNRFLTRHRIKQFGIVDQDLCVILHTE